MNIYEIISVVASIIGFLALIGNVLQYTKKRETSKDLYQLVQTQYNNYYLIARAVTRILNIDTSKISDTSSIKKGYDDDINFVRGVADSARIQLINFSKNQLNKDVYYQHPAYPDRIDFPEAVKMGLPPEKEDSANKIEIAKKILKNKKYQIQKQTAKTTNKGQISTYAVLNEEYGGIPGSNIAIADYSNGSYSSPEIHDDQTFFYVLSGEGKAKIADYEIELKKDSMFVVPPMTKHSIMSCDSITPLRVLWVHNPV